MLYAIHMPREGGRRKEEGDETKPRRSERRMGVGKGKENGREIVLI